MAGSGEAIFSPAIAQRLLAFIAETRHTVPERIFPEVTEREVLGLTAQGCSDARIASHLVLSPKMVRNHISNVFSKLQLTDRAEAIVRAREAGLGTA